jgi:hypothetical protein
MHFPPNIPQVSNQNLNGGGGSVVWNVADWLGLKAEFTGYAFGSGWNRRLQDLGYLGYQPAYLFTYQFGPQLKKHSGKWQPYIASLYGIAHSGGYAAVLRARGDETFVVQSGGGNSNAFAMEVGGGLDIKLSKKVQLRPLELDYQLTRFGYLRYSANQNNFKYFAGMNFTFGEK